MNKKIAPEIRFSGFYDEWEEKKLGDIVILLKDGTHGTHKDGKGAFLLSAKNIKNGKVIVDDITDRKISLDDYNSIYKNYKLENNDVLLTIVGTIGETALYKDNGLNIAFQRSVSIIRGDYYISQSFLYSVINSYSIQKQLKQSASMSAQAGVYLGDLSNIKIYIPNKKEEQTKIGELFKAIDEFISILEKELENLKETKKGFLQKMFPKNDETVPEIRFAGFSDEWEEKKLGDICNISTGKLDANAMIENGDYDFYTSGIKKYKIDIPAFEGPSITIAGNGATVGYMHFADGLFNAYQRTYVLQNFKVDRIFIFYEIEQKLPKKINKEARQGNIPYIVMDMLTQLSILIPKIPEQTKIGNFFKSIDELIEKKENEILKIKDTKKALLQKMFI